MKNIFERHTEMTAQINCFKFLRVYLYICISKIHSKLWKTKFKFSSYMRSPTSIKSSTTIALIPSFSVNETQHKNSLLEDIDLQWEKIKNSQNISKLKK